MATEPRHIRPQRLTDYLSTRVVLNNSGSKITKGMVVRVTGINTADAYFLVIAAAALSNENGPLYVAEEDIENGNAGRVRKTAVLILDTSAAAQGDPVYLAASPAGDISLSAGGVTTQVGWVGTVAAAGVCIIDSGSLGTDTSHSTGDGSDHADVATNTAKVSASVDALFQQRASIQWGELTAAEGTLGVLGALGSGFFRDGSIASDSAPTGDWSADGQWTAPEANAAGVTTVAWARVVSSNGVISPIALPRVTMKGSISTVATCRFFMGLGEEAIATLVGSDAPSASYLAFQFSGSGLRGDTNWQLVRDNASSQTITDTGIAAAADTVLHFEFEWLTTTSVKCSILDNTYTNELYTLTLTTPFTAGILFNSVGMVAEWTGASTQVMLRGYKMTGLLKGGSAVT